MTRSRSRPAVAGPAPGRSWIDAKAGGAVARILGDAQESDHVLDVGRLQKLEAAEFVEGNIAARELDFEDGAVVRGAEQNGLRLERDAGLAALQDSLDDVARLRRPRRHMTSAGLAASALRPEILREALARHGR